jgi:hypothetical protein
MYARLRDYVQSEGFAALAPRAIQAAYASEQKSLVRGPLAGLKDDPVELKRRLADYLQQDFDDVEPYVDKVLGGVADGATVVVVLDNVDLYDDEKLEASVLGEGLAFSKRVHAHVIVCIRDRTYAAHRTDSALDAYELRRLWLDPPPFREVLRKRLVYARKTLEGVRADIELSNRMHLDVPDLSVFFDIVQPSLLGGLAGDYIESLADLDIRRGLSLVAAFLNSGHIQADRLLRAYIVESRTPQFPFHEVFKGTFLGQWKHFKERRSDGVNILDARLGRRALLLLRLHALRFLFDRAQREETVEVPLEDAVTAMSYSGATPETVISCLEYLRSQRLLRTTDAGPVSTAPAISISKAGAYYLSTLASKFEYVETVMLDTAIDDGEVWSNLSNLTLQIEQERGIPRRTQLRRERVLAFCSYLRRLEADLLQDTPMASLACLPLITDRVRLGAEAAVRGAIRNYGADAPT